MVEILSVLFIVFVSLFCLWFFGFYLLNQTKGKGYYPVVYDVHVVNGSIGCDYTDHWLHQPDYSNWIANWLLSYKTIYVEVSGQLGCIYNEDFCSKNNFELVPIEDNKLDFGGRGYTGKFCKVVPTLAAFTDYFEDVYKPTKQELDYYGMVEGEVKLKTYRLCLDIYLHYNKGCYK